MPPKKAEPNKKGQQPIDDDYSDLPALPKINSCFFAALYAFKYRANLATLQKHILKQYLFQQEDPLYAKFRVIQKEDIINLAKLKGLLTEEECLDVSKLPSEKYIDVFAKMTNELLLQAEVPLRRQKRDQFQGMSAQEQQAYNQSKVGEVELTVWLKDFPTTCIEYKALLDQGQVLQQTYIIEELFSPEDEEEDFSSLQFQSSDPAMLQLLQEHEAQLRERMQREFSKEERFQAFRALTNINKLNRIGVPQESELRMAQVRKIKFQGPDPPEELAEGEEERQEDERFGTFAEELKTLVEEQALRLNEYKELKSRVKMVPLMPYPYDPEEAKREEEERQREEQKRLEEEKRQQELIQQQQQQQKGKGKQLPPNKSKQELLVPQSSSQAQLLEEQKRKEEEAKQKGRKKRSQDDEDKDWQTMFTSFNKLRSEIKFEHCNIGTIVSCMVYQLEILNKDSHQGVDFQKPQFFLEQEEEENRLNDYLDDVMNHLVVEHSVKESNFEHKFSERLVQGALGTSPYQQVYQEKDLLSQINDKYKFLNGHSQNKNQAMILNSQKLPGFENRQGMPPTATVSQSERESDVATRLKFCSLPFPQSKRCLLLHEFEKMFKENEPERDFNFLDRNFQEAYDGLTLRQELGSALTLRPMMITRYYDREDSLLIGMYFKTPAGRLLRKQWTYDCKVFPEFDDWNRFVKEEGRPLDVEKMLEISSDKVGFLRKNIKFAFPSDNSIIRVDKSRVGGRRVGNCSVVKDNLTFGVRQRREDFKDMGGGDEEFLNREAHQMMNKSCELWVQFENKVRLLVEMQDHVEVDLDQIPLVEPVPEEDLQKMLDELKNQELPEELKKSEEEIQKEQERQAELEQQQQKGKQSGMKNSDSKTGLNRKSQQKLQTTAMKESESQKQLEAQQQEKQPDPPKPKVNIESQARLHSPYHQRAPYQDGFDPTRGSKMTFTFREGLIVQVLPNGDVSQLRVAQDPEKKKYGETLQPPQQHAEQESQRVITRNAQIIRYFVNGNMEIYFPDGTVTRADKRKGVWETTNEHGIKRVRTLKGNNVYDEIKKVHISVREDPETRATVKIRKDGVLTIQYVDGKLLTLMPDGTQIYKEKIKSNNGDLIIITKEGMAPVRIVNDPVKARAKTVIGLGGTDSLMGSENIMERTNDGKISEVLLPDKTVVQSYFERQELEGYNKFTSNMVHLVRRDDFSVVKVKQDGEVVMISANQRSQLNEIGKKMQLGVNDFDYFFELFGIPSERRSGVYTCNLDQSKLWTQDEEGNTFIVYANGDSVEKLSVSFDLDQLVEGIERKEPSSPKMTDGLYVEEECKFLPPPKTMYHPRLFRIFNGQGIEYFNKEQLEYDFRCKRKDKRMINSSNQIKHNNEDAVSHIFLQRKVQMPPQSVLDESTFPKIPQSVELVNQTFSIQKEPEKEEYVMRNIIEFRPLDQAQINDFNDSIVKYNQYRKHQKDEKARLKIQNVKTDEHRQGECKIWMRIAKERGIKIENLLSDDYKQLKEVHADVQKQQFLDNLDRTFFSDDEEEEQRKTEAN